MPEKRGAGQLQERVAFDERTALDDGYGNTVSGDFVERFQQAAGYTYLRGDEAVDAARLASRQPIVIRTRNSVQARAVTPAWQARDVRKGTLFNIRTITTDDSREFLEMLVESGVATG